jgi:hypothetical protein
MLGVRSVMLNPGRRWAVRWNSVTVGTPGAGYVVRGMGVGRRMRSVVSGPVVSGPVMMRVRVCHSVTARRM